MTQIHESARCRRCGMLVGIEDGERQTLCDCDPYCRICGRQFIPHSALAREDHVCLDCEEQRGELIVEEPEMDLHEVEELLGHRLAGYDI